MGTWASRVRFAVKEVKATYYRSGILFAIYAHGT